MIIDEFATLNLPWMLITLGVVLFLERLIQIPAAYQPFLVFRWLAEKTALRVLKPKDSPRQQKLAGLLTIIVLVFPSISIIAGIIWLSEFPYFFEALLVFFSLSWSGYKKTARQIHAALKQQYKQQAKHLLQPLVLRITQPLSPLGVTKATIEMLVLRSTKQYFTVIFYFLLFGGIGALVYRVFFELSQLWNPKQRKFQYFGQPIAFLCFVLEYLPAKLVGLCIGLLKDLNRSLQTYRQFSSLCRNTNTAWLYACLSAALKVELGGPVMYEQQKLRQARVGQSAVQPEHIIMTTVLLEQVLSLWLLGAVSWQILLLSI